MTSELREGLLGSSPAGETGPGEKDPSDQDDEFDDGRLASRGFGGFMRETGRIALDALPVYAFNVSQFANNILSQAFIGHLGSKELAASALAISYMNVMCQTVNYGLATGQETVVSQANGARRYREVGACLQRGLIVLVVTQLIMSCVSFFGAEIIIAMGQDEKLAQDHQERAGGEGADQAEAAQGRDNSRDKGHQLGQQEQDLKRAQGGSRDGDDGVTTFYEATLKKNSVTRTPRERRR